MLFNGQSQLGVYKETKGSLYEKGDLVISNSGELFRCIQSVPADYSDSISSDEVYFEPYLSKVIRKDPTSEETHPGDVLNKSAIEHYLSLLFGGINLSGEVSVLSSSDIDLDRYARNNVCIIKNNLKDYNEVSLRPDRLDNRSLFRCYDGGSIKVQEMIGLDTLTHSIRTTTNNDFYGVEWKVLPASNPEVEKAISKAREYTKRLDTLSNNATYILNNLNNFYSYFRVPEIFSSTTLLGQKLIDNPLYYLRKGSDKIGFCINSKLTKNLYNGTATVFVINRKGLYDVSTSINLNFSSFLAPNSVYSFGDILMIWKKQGDTYIVELDQSSLNNRYIVDSVLVSNTLSIDYE